jgi:hypothetical protein
MQDTGDFYLDIKPSFMKNPKLDGFNGNKNVSEVLNWLIDTQQYDNIIIRYAGSEGGSDRGKLKVTTWIELMA